MKIINFNDTVRKYKSQLFVLWKISKKHKREILKKYRTIKIFN